MRPIQLSSKIKKLSRNRLIVRLIENEIEDPRHVKIKGLWLEKSALNEEYTHSYFARVLEVGSTEKDIKKGDIIYLNKMYSRTIYRYKRDKEFMIIDIASVVAKIHNFSYDNWLNQKDFVALRIIP